MNFYFKKGISLLIFVIFLLNSIIPSANAQNLLNLPMPGTMVLQSPPYVPVLIKGMTIDANDPFKFDFIIDTGNSQLKDGELKKESERLVKYFLASLTIPKNDLWVNLSPYEKNRIVPDALGKTELGRDMLAQDYLLKQLTASLMYPDKELGKKFWDKIYKIVKEKYGTSDLPSDTFNKVWIIPETASVYEHNQIVYIVDTHLKVMLEEDYLSTKIDEGKFTATQNDPKAKKYPPYMKEILREIIIPEIEKEVNEGQNFAQLRQIYHSLILAKWYKETIKNSLYSKIYFDQKKIVGIEVDDKTIKDKIYDQYMAAYKKGVFNLIKEDYDQLSQEVIPRKYFSGGEKFNEIPLNGIEDASQIKLSSVGEDYKLALRIDPVKESYDRAMLSFETQDDIVDAKQRLARAKIAEKEINDYQFPDMVALINELGFRGVSLGLGSGNTNSIGILNALKVLPYFGSAIVDGNDVRDGRVVGKPNKEFFIEVANKMGKDPKNLVVIEDTVPGIQSAIAGGFGLVIGLARDPSDHERLKEAGANFVYDGRNIGLTADIIQKNFKTVIKGREFEGVIFDLDGVICDLEPIHFEAWKETFDEYFRQRELKYGEKFKEFTLAEYKEVGSGKPSPEVVRSVLKARQIDLPTKIDLELKKRSRIESIVGDLVKKGYGENYVRLFIDKYIKEMNLRDVLDIENIQWIEIVESELNRAEDVVSLLASKGWDDKDRLRLLIYKHVKDMKNSDVLDLTNIKWVETIERELENIYTMVRNLITEDPQRNEQHIWRIVDQHIKRLIQREVIDLTNDKWIGRLKIAYEYWEKKRRIYTYRLVNEFGSPATASKKANIKKLTDQFIEIMQREFNGPQHIDFFIFSGGSGAGNSSVWGELLSRGQVAKQYKKIIMYNTRDRRPDEDVEFSKDLDLSDPIKVETGLKIVLEAILDGQITDDEGHNIDISTIDVRNIEKFKKDLLRWMLNHQVQLSVKGQETLDKILNLKSLGDEGKRNRLDSFTDVYKDQYFSAYDNDPKTVALDPPFGQKKISSKQFEIALSERLGRLKNGKLRIYGEFDGLHYFWLPRSYLEELASRDEIVTYLFNGTDLQAISLNEIREIVNSPVKDKIYILEPIPEFLEKLNEIKDIRDKIKSIIISVVNKVAVVGIQAPEFLKRFDNDDNIAAIGTQGQNDPVDPVDINNIDSVQAYLERNLPDALLFTDGLPEGKVGDDIRALCKDLNVRIIGDSAMTADVPEVLIEHGYKILQAPERGGSSSQTFIALDKTGQVVVIKYADWDGISGNGMPWLRQQKNKLSYIQRKFPSQSRSLYPKVLDFFDDGNQFYYVMEYFKDAEDITQYFFYDIDLTSQQMYDEVDGLISKLVDTHYLPQGTPLPAFEGEVESNLFNRAKYRLHLLRLHEGNVYEHLIKGKPFNVGSLSYKDSSWFFEDLLNGKKISINGKEYYNLPTLLRVFEEKLKDIQASLGPAHFSHYVHSDIPLRNSLRLPDGSIRFIDVRGVNVHDTSPSRVSVEYDIGKIAHSFFMEIVRNKKYQITHAEKSGGTFLFNWTYSNEPGVDRYLDVWKKFRSLLEQNLKLKELFKEEETQRWIEYVFLLETFNYLSDAIHRFSQDPTGEDPLMYYLQGTIGLSDFLAKNGLIPPIDSADSIDPKKAVEVLQGPWLVSPPLSIVQNQLEIVEKGLGSSKSLTEKKVKDVLDALRSKTLILKGEEVDIYDQVGENAKVIGQLDRNIADKFEYIHETVNAIVISPDKTKVLLTRRSHNKEQFPLALTIPGGHLLAGQSARDGMASELEEELELISLNGKLQEVSLYSYEGDPKRPTDTTKERRVLYIYQLTEQEYQKVLTRQQELETIAKEEGEEGLKKALEVKQFEGIGEVWSYHAVQLEELLASGESFQVKDILSGYPINVPFAPDLLTHLLDNPDIIAKAHILIRDMNIPNEILSDKAIEFFNQRSAKENVKDEAMFTEHSNSQAQKSFKVSLSVYFDSASWLPEIQNLISVKLKNKFWQNMSSVYPLINGQRRIFYPGSGADASSFLIGTNASEGYFLTHENVNFSDSGDFFKMMSLYNFSSYSRNFALNRLSDNLDTNIFQRSSFYTGNPMILPPVLLELYCLGIKEVSVIKKSNKIIELIFKWQHPMDTTPKERRLVVFGETNIEQLDEHQETLPRNAEGVFMKALRSESAWEADFEESLEKYLGSQAVIITDHPVNWQISTLQSHWTRFYPFNFTEPFGHGEAVFLHRDDKSEQWPVLEKSLLEELNNKNNKIHPRMIFFLKARFQENPDFTQLLIEKLRYMVGILLQEGTFREIIKSKEEIYLQAEKLMSIFALVYPWGDEKQEDDVIELLERGVNYTIYDRQYGGFQRVSSETNILVQKAIKKHSKSLITEQKTDLVESVTQVAFENLKGIALHKGGLAFDVDDTLLFKEAAIKKAAQRLGVTEEALEQKQIEIVSERFSSLLEITHLAIITGNDFTKQWQRFGKKFEEYLRLKNKLNLFEGLTIYANGGASKVTFKVENDKVVPVYDAQYAQSFSFHQDDIQHLREFFNELIGQGELLRMYKRAVEAQILKPVSQDDLVQALKDAYDADHRPVRAENYNWIYGQPFSVSVQNSNQLTNDRTNPWLEMRGEGENVVQVSLKLLPSILEIEVNGARQKINIGNTLRNEIIDLMEKRGILSDKFTMRPAGLGTTDIGASKDKALEDFIEINQMQSENVIYFGDEFNNRGNDAPILKVHNINVVNVSGQLPQLTNVINNAKQIIPAGNSPEHTWLLLKYLSDRSLVENPGGIDMNNINVKRQGNKVKFNYNPDSFLPILNDPIVGFRPVIINMTPLPSLAPLLGLDKSEKTESLAVSSL